MQRALTGRESHIYDMGYATAYANRNAAFALLRRASKQLTDTPENRQLYDDIQVFLRNARSDKQEG